MGWKIHYFNKAMEAGVLQLPDTLLARYIRLTDLMMEFGPNLGMPHTRALGEGLFELRLKGKEGIARIFYCTLIGKKIMMLHSFVKKSEKTPKKELSIARARLKKLMR